MRSEPRERADNEEGGIAEGCEWREGEEGQGRQGGGEFERGGKRDMGSVPWWEQRHQWGSDCVELRGMYIRDGIVNWFGGRDFLLGDKWIESFISRRP